jgi:hypothetical protein
VYQPFPPAPAPFPPTQPATRRGISLQWGLLAGVVMLLLNIINIVGLGAGPIVFIINLLVMGVAGLLASRETGKVSTGVIAGLIAGAIGFLDIFVKVFYQVITSDTPGGIGVVAAGALIALVLFEGLAIGLGAGIGAIGGLIGRGVYNSSHPQPTQTFMPPMAAPMPPMQGAYGPPSVYPPSYPAQPSGAYPPQYPPAAPYPPESGQASGAYPPAYPPQYPPQAPYPPQYPQG